MKLLSAKMPVIWKPMTQSIRCAWNNLLAKANTLADLKQESIMVMERRNDEPLLWNTNANGLNYTEKRQSLHPTKNLRDALIITLV